MILIYHGIVQDVQPKARWCVGQAIPFPTFQRHLDWLLRRFRPVALDEYLATGPRERGGSKRRLVTITFDDGSEKAFRLVYPLLKDRQVAATFFVPTSHLNGGPLLWFNIINALCFDAPYSCLKIDGEILSLASLAERKEARQRLGQMAAGSGDVRTFSERLAALYPLPAATRAEYGGMTHEQLRGCCGDELIEIGAHTLTHPLLSQLDESSHAREVIECRSILAGLTGRKIRYFAYPGGDYTVRTLEYVRQAGYKAAFCTVPNRLRSEAMFEIERIGVYSPQLYKLCMKAFGVVPVMRRLGFSVG